MRRHRKGRLPDPSWKSGPTYPEPTSEEHRPNIDTDYDFDGLGVSEAEQLDGDPLIAVRIAQGCLRDGCDEERVVALLYSTECVSDEVREVLDAQEDYHWTEYFRDNAVVTDVIADPYIGTLVLGVEVGDETIGSIEPEEVIRHDFEGACYGNEEPEPDIDAYRYDL